MWSSKGCGHHSCSFLVLGEQAVVGPADEFIGPALSRVDHPGIGAVVEVIQQHAKHWDGHEAFSLRQFFSDPFNERELVDPMGGALFQVTQHFLGVDLVGHELRVRHC